MPLRNQDKLQIALCALRPPTDELRVPLETAHLFHFVPYLYPVRKWETCPRGKAICSKVNPNELSGVPAANKAGVAVAVACNGRAVGKCPRGRGARFRLTA